jgi:hypothetical protein
MGFDEILLRLVVVLFVIFMCYAAICSTICEKHEFVLTYFEPNTWKETGRPCVGYKAICKHCNKDGKFPASSRYGSFWLVYGCNIADPLEFIKYVR